MLQGRFGMLQTPSCLIFHAFSLLRSPPLLFFLSSSPSISLPLPPPFSLLLFLRSSALTLTPTFYTLPCFFSPPSAQFSLNLHVFIQCDAHPLSAKINHETAFIKCFVFWSLLNEPLESPLVDLLFISFCCRLFSAGCGNLPPCVKSVQSAFRSSSLLVQDRLMWGQHTLILLLSEARHHVKPAAQQN